MFKTFIRSLGVLFCLVGLTICALIYTQPAALASAYVPMDDPTPTPTATTTTTYTPSLNLALPTGGTPAGHAGTVIQLTGAGFPPNSDVSFSIATDANQCATGNGGVAALQPQQPAKADANGGFMVQAAWPDGANQPNTKYYVCASASGSHAAAGTPFTFVGAPTVTSSSQNVTAGDKVTITGQNWLPQQALNIAILAGSGGNPIATAQTTPDANGNFSIDVEIPAGTAAGNYSINVTGATDPTQKANADNALTISAQATPTPGATATPTPGATATPTPAATPTAASSGGSGSNPGMLWLIFGLGGIGVVLVIVGLTMFLSHSHNA
ncbi:hypothetical protein KDA_11270 [Dictyobacter alpinus]|uniref:IPT/TIG domain-containing protein n=1 Tax=Dictyobacter alpinus TaxID=2014873 RepID=A0A402B2U5_9CHLR|nr:hypothetical protein [Dictyobacter alpinus]GCE25643.1 hypothetical protein KDA_11270 [Dictyobacter alpinus]